ncbi:MAG: PAS domain S-box protein [Cyanobacteriota bacterium]|nr:PAS domain S-box protein [Cyanobacteriota bacterium]
MVGDPSSRHFDSHQVALLCEVRDLWQHQINSTLCGDHPVPIGDLTERGSSPSNSLAQTKHSLSSQTIFEQTDHAFLVLNLDNTIDDLNPAFAQLLGYSPSHLVGKPIQDILHSDDLVSLLSEQANCLDNQALSFFQARRFFNWEHRVVNLCSKIIFLTANDPDFFEAGHASAVYKLGSQHQAQSKKIGYLIQVCDIDHEQQIKQLKQDQEERFRQTFELAPIAKAITNLSGSYLQINAAFTQTLGYRIEDLAGKQITDITHPDDVVATLERGYKLLDDPHSLCEELEKRYLHKDGSVIHAILRITLVRDSRQKPAYFMSQILDISRRKRAEDALLASEARFRAIYEQSALGISLADPQGHYLRTNPAFQKMVGYSEEELSTKTFIELTDAKDISQDLQLHSQLLSGKLEHYQIEKQYVCKSGQLLWVRLIVSALKDPQGRLQCTIAISEDISLQKQQQVDLELALHEKVVLLREIHHRVKNNLQIISSLLRLQSDSIKNPKYLKVFRDAISRVQAMSLVHEKLYQSKDLGQIKLLDYLETLLTNLLQSYGVYPDIIHFTIDVGDIFLSIDNCIICGLIINELVTNSLKHAFPRSRHGAISVQFRQDQSFTFLTVADNGLGIPDHLDLKTTESLGLQLVAALTDQLEAKIEIDSSGGTKFSITFPRIDH